MNAGLSSVNVSQGNDQLAFTPLYLCPSFLAGDGQHRDPCGAQHPDDGGSGFHRHELVCQSCLSGLPGCKSLPPLEGSPAGLVCRSCTALLSAHCRRGAQLCSARPPGGVPEGGV